jgi:hypothetical protein
MGSSRSSSDRRLQIKIQVNFGNHDVVNMGFTEDISISGIFLKTAVVFPVGTQLRIEMCPESGGMIRLLGKVHWSKQVAPNLVWTVAGAGMGVEVVRFLQGKELYYDLLRGVGISN